MVNEGGDVKSEGEKDKPKCSIEESERLKYLRGKYMGRELAKLDNDLGSLKDNLRRSIFLSPRYK